MPLGADIGEGVAGEPTLYNGRVTDLEGKPLRGALLDVWSGDGEGVYDMQRDGSGMRARARIRTDDEGHYRFWSIQPIVLPGARRRAGGRHAAQDGPPPEPPRPHPHEGVGAGPPEVMTHLFVKDSPYLDSDAVFGVRNSLIVDFAKHAAGHGAGRARAWTSRSTRRTTTSA